MYDNETKELINQLDKQAKEIQSKIDELKENGNKVKNVRWKAETSKSHYGQYYTLNIDMEICPQSHTSNSCHDIRYSVGNYFKTKQEAEKYKQHLIITQQLKDIALRLNNGVEIDLKNWMDICRQKYKIVLKPYNNVLLQAISTSIVDLGQVYCLSDKFLETAIKEIGEKELIEYIKGC